MKPFISLLISSLLLILLSSESLFSQKIDLKIQAFGTKEAIPYAHARIVGSNTGGVANAEGILQLLISDKQNDNKVLFSAVGFQPLEVPVAQLINKKTVFLKEAVIALDQITVRYVDQAKKLVSKAIDNISVNYPSDNQFLYGFYRESAFADTSYQQVYYQLEAYTKTLKTSYSENTSNGHVLIEKGRLKKSQLNDSLFVKFYSGPHLPHRMDYIKKRISVFDRKKMDQFEFEILDTLMYQGKKLFEVGYTGRNKGIGYNKIYIQDSTYAITKLIFVKKFNEEDDPFSLFNSKNERIKNDITVEYVPRKKEWILGRITYETAFKNEDNKEAYVVAEYATQTCENTTENSIPYENRFFYRDITYDFVSSMDSSFWQQQSILIPEKSSPYLFNDSVNFDLKKSKLDKKLDIFRKFTSSVYIGYRLINFQSREVDITIDELTYSGNYNQPNDYSIVFGNSIAYNFRNNWYVDLKMHSSISNSKYNSVNSGVYYQKNLNPGGRPFHLTTGFSLQYNNYNSHLSKVNSSSDFKIGYKKFNSSEIDIFASTREFALSPFVQIGLDINPQIKIFTGFSHPVSIIQNEGVLIKEKGDLINQKKFIRSSNIPFNEISNTPFKNYLFTIGGSFRL
ncbi:hypothetical protein QYS49_34215 [Marivirga salinae]|uniref:Carboxypeptidase-like regulatory domain-containing protein n=1 Tax=Marivirga salinarum TaxID=3059078 RepID=A0AA51NCA9_9BACT|nr:hypothetical protein [Marivirga sp. BDSF4-3]WMN12649.1 hypothetical protein QYS49_34215 [Marivirga sp. BDSF4-3]